MWTVGSWSQPPEQKEREREERGRDNFQKVKLPIFKIKNVFFSTAKTPLKKNTKKKQEPHLYSILTWVNPTFFKPQCST
jgi:hypothetical protein